MQLSENIQSQLVELIEPLADNLGLELIEVSIKQENRKKTVDIVVDKNGGVNVDDCAALSRQISLLLDVEDILPFSYNLEVGSPGIFRVLNSEKEIIRNINARVKAEFISPVKGKKRFIGLLKAFEGKTVVLADEQREISVDLKHIKKIQLHPELTI